MTVYAETEPLILTSYSDVKSALGNADLTRNDDRLHKGNIVERAIIVLDGLEHRDRRRVENALFRIDRLLLYETDLFPNVIDQTLDRVIESGAADLMDIGFMLAITLSARTAGVDFDQDSLEQRRVLLRLTHRLHRATTIDAAIGDIEEIKRDAWDALESLKADFIGPSWDRKQRMVDDFQAGRASEDELPRDLLTLLLQHRAELQGMDDDMILRETAFYLETGANTSSHALTTVLHCIFEWARQHPEDWERLRTNRLFLQRCVQEALRLRPNNPMLKRRALRATQIGAWQVTEGKHIHLSVAVANRDPSIYGGDAESFNPYRAVPDTGARYGYSFGGGQHACIGRVQAIGLPIRFDEPAPYDHQFGLVTLATEALIARGVSPHPSKEPVHNTETRRWTRWSSYPVVFHQ